LASSQLTSNTPNTTQSTTSSHNTLPGWAIAVIVIASIALICGAAALIWTTVISRRNKKNNKLIPIVVAPGEEGRKPANEKILVDNVSMNSQAPILAYRSSDSMAMRESSIASRPTVFNDSSAIEAFRSEALLQKQLEEDGTSVKHAGRFTHVKSLADIQKSAVVEQPPH
ncbi:hypothetical protein CU098_000532, partial [Rhizopus stolonifer]